MALYDEVSALNLIPQIRGKFRMEVDGRVGIPLVAHVDSAWLESGICEKRKCNLWLHVYFKHFGVLPLGCSECWKTYFFPRSLDELMKVRKFQQEDSRLFVNVPSKCGIEMRPFSGRLGGYGAYWYNPLGCGLAVARKNTHTLSEALGVELMLKRGCTEIEQFTVGRFGLGSDDWGKLLGREMRMKEELLDATFYEVGVAPERTPRIIEVDVLQRWIEYAAEHGDSTYLNYVSKPFFPKLVQYVGSKHKPEDFPGGKYESDNHGMGQEAGDRGSCGEEPSGIKTLAEM